MRVLGVDPGLAATGYGVVEFEAGRIRLIEGGVIRSNPDDPMENRVGSIFSGITEILHEFRPELVAMEDLYSHYKHPRTAIIMAHARGAVLAAAHQKAIPVRSYAATMIKMALTGNGRARKEQVQRMVLSQLGVGVPVDPFDTTDALAAALCHLNQTMKVLVA
jgi:crossover junction endodeoxyribonuclease RuvC